MNHDRSPKPCVILLVQSLTRSNGGASTALDLAEGLDQLGCRVVMFLTGDSSWVYRASRSRSKLTSLPLDRIRTVRDPQKMMIARQPWCFRGSWKKVFKETLTWVNVRSHKRSAKRWLADADIVVNAGGLSGVSPRDYLPIPDEVPVVLNHNGSIEAFTEYFLNRGDSTSAAWPTDYRSFISAYDFLLFQSPDVALDVIERFPTYTNRFAVVSPSCQEDEIYKSQHMPSPFAETRFPVVVVGSIQQRKGQVDAVEALAKIRHLENVDLHFVGPLVEEEYASLVVDRSKDLGVQDRVHLHGLRKDYARYLSHAAVVLQPSYAEGVSRVLRESLLLGKAIVAYDIPGTAATLTDGYDALLVAAGDTSALAQSLERLFVDKELVEYIETNARSTFTDRFSWGVFLQGIEQLLEIALATPSARIA